MANLQIVCPVNPGSLHFDQARLQGSGDNIPATNKLIVAWGTTPGGPYPNIGPGGGVAGDNTVGQQVDNIFCFPSPNTTFYFVVQELDAGNAVIDTSAECSFTTANDGGANYWNAGPDCSSQVHGNFDIPGFISTRNEVYYTEPPMDDGSICGATLDRRIEVGPTNAGPWTVATLDVVSGSNPGPALLSPGQGFGQGVATAIGFLEECTTYFIRATLIVNGVDTGVPQVCGPFTTGCYPTPDCAQLLGDSPTSALYNYFPNFPAEQFNTQQSVSYSGSPNNTDRIRVSVGTAPGGPYPLVFEEDAEDFAAGGVVNITGLSSCTQYFAIIEYLERDNGDNPDPNNYVAYATSPECSFYTKCPTPDCTGATAITTTTATLNGIGHSIPAPNQLAFNYGTSPGMYTSTTTPNTVGNGTDPQAYSFNVTGLIPGTTYYFVAIVLDSTGTQAISEFSSECSFATLPGTTVDTDPATSVGVPPGCATLNGHSNDHAAGCVYRFRWGTTPGGPYPNVVAATPGLSTVTAPEAFTAQACGLPPGNIYYIAEVQCGLNVPVEGGEQTFVIPAPLIDPCEAATNVTETSATLNATSQNVPAGYTYRFRYGTTPGGPYGTIVPAGASSGASPDPYSANVAGLTQGTTYYYISETLDPGNVVVATAGECSFATVVNPTQVITDPPVFGPLNGCVTLNGNSVDADPGCAYSFVWGTTLGGPYPNTVAGNPAVSTGASPENFSAVVCVPPGTTVYYRAVVTCNNNPIQGEELAAPVPAIICGTSVPSNVTTDSATLNGSAINVPAGYTYEFAYGTQCPAGPFDHNTGIIGVADGTNPDSPSAPVVGLTPNTEYCYQLIIRDPQNNIVSACTTNLIQLQTSINWCGGWHTQNECTFVPTNDGGYWNCNLV